MLCAECNTVHIFQRNMWYNRKQHWVHNRFQKRKKFLNIQSEKEWVWVVLIELKGQKSTILYALEKHADAFFLFNGGHEHKLDSTNDLEMLLLSWTVTWTCIYWRLFISTSFQYQSRKFAFCEIKVFSIGAWLTLFIFFPQF